MIKYILLLSYCLAVVPLHGMNSQPKNACSYGKDRVSGEIEIRADLQSSETIDNLVKALFELIQEPESFDGGVSLPTAIADKESLQRYAAHYARASHQQFKHRYGNTIKLDTKKHPCLRMLQVEKEEHATLRRVKEIFSLYKDAHSSSVISENSVDYYFYVNYHSEEQKKINVEYFQKFLMKNNSELLVGYKDVLFNLREVVGEMHRNSLLFVDKVKLLNAHEIAEWLGLEQLSSEQRNYFIDRVTYVNNDISRLVVSFNFIVKNIDHIQLMDLYLLSEQSFHNLQVIEELVKRIIKYGSFLVDDDVDITVAPVKNIQKFFHHRQIPIRSLYLMSRATAFFLRDFADKLRARAGLPSIPQGIFEQSDALKDVLTIDDTMLSVENYIRQKKQREKSHIQQSSAMSADEREAERSEWLKDTLVVSSSKKPQRTPKKGKQNNKSKTQPRTKQTIPRSSSSLTSSISPLIEPVVDELTNPLPQGKLSVGERVCRLLSNDEKAIFAHLFSLKENTLSQGNVNLLTMAVYKALIDLNKAHRAAEFLKKSTDSRIFTKGKNEQLLSRVAMEHRLLPYLLQDLVHPDFDKEALLKGSDFIRERVIMEKILLHGDEIDTTQLGYLEDILRKGEEVLQHTPAEQQRILLVNLAHAWHKLALALERAKGVSHKADALKSHQEKIESLLTKAITFLAIKDVPPVSILEAYLFSYYLKRDVRPTYKALDLETINAIKRRATDNMANPFQVPPKTIHKVTPSGKKVGEFVVDNSIYHLVTNDELGDYIVVTFDRPMNDRKIPLFVYYNDTIYRTDVFGGSRLKQSPAKGDYGSLIGVSLHAADFFQYWFTSMASFWYGQRAFMPAKPDQKTKALTRKLNIATIPDESRLAVLGDLIVQDGFGYVKASVAKHLNLNPVNRLADRHQKYVAFQALHGYGCQNKEAAQELFRGAKNALRQDGFSSLSPNEQAHALMCTPPKLTAVGVPVAGDDVWLADDMSWRDVGHSGVMIGRNPYSAKRIQVVKKHQISYRNELNTLPVFQYTLTGYIDKNGDLLGSFFKGLLAVIPDEQWPKAYKDAHILVSGKDQKLNQSWRDEKTKNYDQKTEQMLNFTGVLIVKNEYHKTHIMGLPTAMAEKLAGDYDGDPYDVMPRKGYEQVSAMVEAESLRAIPNPKISKPFIPRMDGGNFEKILGLRKPLNSDWNSINNRFNYLSHEQRETVIEQMAQTHMLESCLGKSWREKLDLKEITPEDIVVSEIQLGLKYGEDAYKTDVDINSVLERDREYQKVLSGFSSSIPYGNSLKKKLEEKQGLKQATEPALLPKHSANIVDKAFRGLARYLTGDKTYDAYVSDDEEEIKPQDE